MNGYLGVVTSIFMAKPQETGIQLYSEMLAQGYRFFTDAPIHDLNDLSYLRAAIGPLEAKLGVVFRVDNFLYLGKPLNQFTIEYFADLVKYRGYFPLESGHAIKPELWVNPVTRQFVVGEWRCFFLRRDQNFEIRLVAGLHLYLAEMAARIGQILRESGIDYFWWFSEGWRKVQSDRQFQLGIANGRQLAKIPNAIPLESHVQVVFYFWMIWIGAGSLCFVGEVGRGWVLNGIWKFWYFMKRIDQQNRVQTLNSILILKLI